MNTPDLVWFAIVFGTAGGVLVTIIIITWVSEIKRRRKEHKEEHRPSNVDR